MKEKVHNRPIYEYTLGRGHFRVPFRPLEMYINLYNRPVERNYLVVMTKASFITDE